MKKITLLILGLLPLSLFGQASDLFISEYMEGSSNNKYIEIFNGTGSDVDLSGYEIWRIANAGDWAEGQSNAVALKGIISNNDVWIICNSQANADIKAAADSIGSSATYFNGNDAIGLAKNGVLIDALGEESTSTPANFDVAGVTGAMGEHTLVRKSTVSSGNTDWVSSAGTNADDSEWIVLGQDDISNIGFHVFNGTASNIPSTISFLTPVSVPGANEDYMVSAKIFDADTLVNAVLQFIIGTDSSEVDMVSTGSDSIYSGTISAVNYTDGSAVQYRILAIDKAKDSTFADGGSFLAGTTPINTLKQLEEDFSLSFSGFAARVTGDATVNNGIFSGSDMQVYMQDGTGGINIFAKYAADTAFSIGHNYTVTGTIGFYNGLAELVPANPGQDIVDNGATDDPAPLQLSIASLLSNPEAFEGMLVQISNADTVAGSAAWPTTGNNANITITDDGGTSQLTMRIDKDTDIDEAPQTSYPANVVGIVSQYDSSSPYTDGYQLLPRAMADISPVTALDNPRNTNVLPRVFKLYNAYPNPFNPQTTLSFDLPQQAANGLVELSIYNVLGQKIITLYSGKLNSGHYSYKWNATNQAGSVVPSGIYFAKLVSSAGVQMKRMVLIK